MHVASRGSSLLGGVLVSEECVPCLAQGRRREHALYWGLDVFCLHRRHVGQPVCVCKRVCLSTDVSVHLGGSWWVVEPDTPGFAPLLCYWPTVGARCSRHLPSQPFGLPSWEGRRTRLPSALQKLEVLTSVPPTPGLECTLSREQGRVSKPAPLTSPLHNLQQSQFVFPISPKVFLSVKWG